MILFDCLEKKKRVIRKKQVPEIPIAGSVICKSDIGKYKQDRIKVTQKILLISYSELIGASENKNIILKLKSM